MLSKQVNSFNIPNEILWEIVNLDETSMELKRTEFRFGLFSLETFQHYDLKNDWSISSGRSERLFEIHTLRSVI